MEIGPANIRRARPLLGTFVEIAAAVAAQCDVDAAIEVAFDAVAKVHRLMSFHELTSDVSRLNREASKHAVTVDAWTYDVLETALDMHLRSKGLVDVTVAPVLQNLGLLPFHGKKRTSPTAVMHAHEAIELLSDCRVRFLDAGITIDLGGIAKGFAVDRALAALRAHGVSSGLVNAGGDLAGFGPTAHAVHIRDPHDPFRLLCRVDVRDEAVASSGTRFDLFGSHDIAKSAIVDPRDRAAVCAIKGATVRASSCMLADALTKVVMIAGESAITVLDQYGASALLILPNGDLQLTSNWQRAVSLAA